MLTSFRSAVAASYATLTGCFKGIFQIGKVSNFAYRAFLPRMYSWYSCDRLVASLPLPPPGPVTTIKGFVTSMYGFAPYPSSLTIVSTSVGYPFVNRCLYVRIPLCSSLLMNLLTAGDSSSYRVTTTLLISRSYFRNTSISRKTSRS